MLALLQKKNIAIAAGFAAAEIGAKKLLEPGNFVSDSLHESITTYMRYEDGSKEGYKDMEKEKISYWKPTTNQLQILQSTLQTRSDVLSSQEREEMINHVYIFEGGSKNNLMGFVTIKNDNHVFIHEKTLVDPSTLLHIISHEWQHRKYRMGHELCAVPAGLLPFLSMPIIFNLISKKTLTTRIFGLLGACASSYITIKTVTIPFNRNSSSNEEKRADTRAVQIVSCAGCANKIIAQMLESKLSEEQKNNLDESGYTYHTVYTDPKWLAQQRQSCDLCSPEREIKP